MSIQSLVAAHNKGGEAVITAEQEQSIAATIARMGGLSKGIGTKEQACSIAAINLALSGRLTDEVPDCMSETIGKWVIGAQDAMPAATRNSREWQRLLLLAAGTGRSYEAERLAIIMDWLWSTVLPSLQGAADARGFGAEWHTMRLERTPEAARMVARVAARAAVRGAAEAAAWAAARAAEAEAAARNARASAAAAWAAREAARGEAREGVWETFDPVGLLARLVAVTDPRASIDTSLTDTQRAILEAAERRGYDRGWRDCRAAVAETQSRLEKAINDAQVAAAGGTSVGRPRNGAVGDPYERDDTSVCFPDANADAFANDSIIKRSLAAIADYDRAMLAAQEKAK